MPLNHLPEDTTLPQQKSTSYFPLPSLDSSPPFDTSFAVETSSSFDTALPLDTPSTLDAPSPKCYSNVKATFGDEQKMSDWNVIQSKQNLRNPHNSYWKGKNPPLKIHNRFSIFEKESMKDNARESEDEKEIVKGNLKKKVNQTKHFLKEGTTFSNKKTENSFNYCNSINRATMVTFTG